MKLGHVGRRLVQVPRNINVQDFEFRHNLQTNSDQPLLHVITKATEKKMSLMN